MTANAPIDTMQPCVQETQWDRDLAAAEMMPDDFAFNAASHFLKAVRKHPRFADALFGDDAADDAQDVLDAMRRELDYLEKNNWLDASALATCEIAEAQLANAQGDNAACVDELYDAVAVLMRMIAVVEGKQKLGGEK